MAQGQTLLHIGTHKVRQALQGSLGLRGEVVIEVVKGPIESRNADLLSALGQGQHRTGFQVIQVAQWALTTLDLPHHIRPVIVAINPVHRPGKRTVVAHIADLQKGIHRQCCR